MKMKYNHLEAPSKGPRRPVLSRDETLKKLMELDVLEEELLLLRAKVYRLRAELKDLGIKPK